MQTKSRQSFRLDAKLTRRLDKASTGRLAPTKTKIVERGIELALKELDDGKAQRVRTATGQDAV